MSLSECDRFSADLKSNEALRGEFQKFQGGASKNPLPEMVALAVSKRYGVTVDEARQHLKAKAFSEAEPSPIPSSTVLPGVHVHLQ